MDIERIIPGNSTYINDEKLKIMGDQKDKSICKIIKNEKPIGTGFLCYIPVVMKKRITLITAYHVIGEEDLKIDNNIKLSFNDNKEKLIKIKIDNLRHIYANENDDIVMIEIKDYDNSKNIIILEIDKNLFGITFNNFKEKYENKSIYIIHYPKGMLSSLSVNVIKLIDNSIIFHLSPTEFGSSGSPILNLDNLKVIGNHLGYKTNEKYNMGLVLKESIHNFNFIVEKKIKLTLEITNNDNNKEIYFISKEYKLKYQWLFF